MSEPMSEDALNRIQAMIDKAVETVPDCDQAAPGVAGFCFTRATSEDRDLLVPKTLS